MAMTKKEMFAQVIAMAQGEALSVSTDEIVEFATHEIELLSKKSGSARKPTKSQVEGARIKASIIEVLAETDAPMTVGEMMEHEQLSGLTSQRVTALVTQLFRAGKVDRTEVKKKAYFSLPEIVEE